MQRRHRGLVPLKPGRTAHCGQAWALLLFLLLVGCRVSFWACWGAAGFSGFHAAVAAQRLGHVPVLGEAMVVNTLHASNLLLRTALP